MNVTIPRFGNTYIAVKALFEQMHIPYIMPDENNKKTLQDGARISPQDICLPFKIMMGGCMACIEKGADTVIITGSCGPCRFGEYCELQMKLLERLGYDVDVIVIDAPSEIGKDEFLRRIGKISKASRVPRSKKLLALKNAADILAKLDHIDTKAHERAGYEINKGECSRLLNKCKADVYDSTRAEEMRKKLKAYAQKLDAVKMDTSRHPVKVALVGEIYSMIEPFANLHIEEKLADMGVSTVRHMTTSWWIKDLLLKPLKLNSLDVRRLSRPHLPYKVGGHAKESIAHALMAKRKGLDGAIQVFPLGCMPEIITKSILPGIQSHDFPIMTLVIDEMTGEAGYDTRIEAFIDMLYTKRQRKGHGFERSLQLRY